jgi:hypothetical protein
MDVDKTLDYWRNQLERSTLMTSDEDLLSMDDGCVAEGSVLPVSDLRHAIDINSNINVQEKEVFLHDIDSLNEDQRRAYDIVDSHLQDTLDGKMPSQLLMVIPGEGGVGKSKVIQSITQNFKRRGIGDWCVRGAYTGIAASLIDGKTLHVLAGIPIRGGKQSSRTLKKLREFWHTKRYLIIDEVSMLSRAFFAKLCHIISTVMENETDQVFGGVNVILAGDFHQFPPVVAHRSAPLYWPVDAKHDSEEDILGRKIYEQFSTVVQLNKQIRVQDPVWQNVLQHVRYGNCRQQHIDIIKKLIITNDDGSSVDYSVAPWKDARLVTPRHAVRTQWNTAAIKKHCENTRRRLYICPAEDTIEGRPVTNKEKIAILTKKKGTKSQSDQGGLTKEIELAIGVPVMVTLNIRTEMDVANGVRGTLEGIVLDERERMIATNYAFAISTAICACEVGSNESPVIGGTT